MKKLYALSLLFLGTIAGFSQTFYSENMGTPTGNTTVANYNIGTAPATFQNLAPISYTGTAAATMMRVTSPSSGYTGVSGSGNVFFAAAGGNFFQIAGLNTSTYSAANLQLSFGYLTSATSGQMVVETSTDGTTWTPLTFTNNSNTSWNLVTITSGIPSSATLQIRFTAPATSGGMRIDDVKLTNVSSTCTLTLGSTTGSCDASTLGTDTYTATIAYTGGGNATYIVTPNVGTVGGDNPTSVAAGNIIISGINEGVALTVNITGGTCNLSTSVSSPECKPINALPYSEPFPYTVGSSLGVQQKWTNVNSGDDILGVAGNLTYTGVTSTGNSVSFSGAGIDTFTPYTATTSGTVYSSFLMNVTDMSNVTTDGNETVFASVTDSGKGFRARIMIKRNGTQFQIGCTSSSTLPAASTVYGPTLYNVGSTVLIVTGYDFGLNELKLWVNPVVATFTAATPATITETPAAAFANLGGFLLRQDAANLTPTMTIDELRVGTTIGQILSASSFGTISGLKVYPNPTKTVLNITSDSFADKNVEIYNVLGKVVLTAKVTNAPINVANLASGVYIVKVTEEGKSATRRLVIE